MMGLPKLTQGRLDFGPPAFERAAFIEAPENASVRRQLAQWQHWPGGAFCIYGQSGTGKSHLASLWAEDAQAAFLTPDDLNSQIVLDLDKQARFVVALDRADEAEEADLFALLTRLERQGGALLLVARSAPKAWEVQLPDLRSRLAAIAIDYVEEPGLQLLGQLIARHAAARGYRLDETAVNYLANRIPRTEAAAREVAEAMESVATLSLKSPMALAQKALRAYQPDRDYEGETKDLFDD